MVELTSFPPQNEIKPKPTLYGRLSQVFSSLLEAPEDNGDDDAIPQDVESPPPTPQRESTPPSNSSQVKVKLSPASVSSTYPKGKSTVSLNTTLAVPTLPSTSYAQSPAPAGDMSMSDVDSIFSVASASASRDYLANQYARGRARTRGAAASRLSRDFWMKDENATTCFACGRPFTTFRRKHHCRVCGQIFCSSCTRFVGPRRIRCCPTCEDALDDHSSSEDETMTSFIGSPAPPRVLDERDEDDDELESDGQSARLPSILASTEPAPHLISSPPASAPPPPPPLPLGYMSTARFPQGKTIELNTASRKYASLFLDRVIQDSGLDMNWHSVLIEALLEVTPGLHLDNPRDRWVPPREWVKVKRIPGGTERTIDVISGLVFTHILARKAMPLVQLNPRILTVSFSIEYSGAPRYHSLGPVLAQEHEYLRKLVARIASLRPTLLFTCGSVCGAAMQMLEDAGVSVATRVEPRALVRIARYTGADLLGSIDRLSVSPCLGTCNDFYVQTYRYGDTAKTFMFIKYPHSEPGRTALIRGDPDVSRIVKVVMEVMVDVMYSLKIETSLMRDQFVRLPSLVEPVQVLSSSPFVDYGKPFLLEKSQELEDEIVVYERKLEQPPEYIEGLDLGRLSLEKSLEARQWLEQVLRDAVALRWREAMHQWEQVSSPDLWNPSSHQNLLLQFFLTCTETQTPCVGPDALLIDFYLDTDQTLGQFVESTISSYSDVCPDGCSKALGEHHREYVHGSGKLTIHVENSPCKIPGLQDCILMWSWCRVCDRQTPVAPMSPTTWKYSFGKYLELSFWGTALGLRAGTCDHNLYRDHERFFGWHDRLIRISYSPVDLYEIQVPPLMLGCDPKTSLALRLDYVKELETRINRFWDSISDRLSKIKVEGLEEAKLAEARERIEKLEARCEVDRHSCLDRLRQNVETSHPADLLAVNEVFILIQDLVDQWHVEFADFDGLFFPSERDIRRVTLQHLRGLVGDAMFEDEAPKTTGDESETKQPSTTGSHILNEEKRTRSESGETTRSGLRSPSGPADSPDNNSVRVRSKYGTNIDFPLPILSQNIRSPEERPVGRVSLMARHFEELSAEFERERQREKQRLHDRRRAMKSKQTHPIAEVFSDVEDAINDREYVRPGTPLPSEGERDGNSTDRPVEAPAETASLTESEAPSENHIEATDSESGRKPSAIRQSLLQSLANFWAERSSTRWTDLEYVLTSKQHFFTNSLVVIREDEPSSIIAFCLSLPDYRDRLNAATDTDAAAKQTLMRTTGTHLRYQFEQGTTSMSCKIFYAQQFDALRTRCGCSDSDGYIQSLSRCSVWDNSGGKSGSSFLKTHDGRFVLKELSQVEFDAFASFAPSYFEYMVQALFHDLPTCLAKFYGIYQITIRNTAQQQQKMYVMVMENVFRGRNFTRMFDLKGSMRNRRAAETGKANEVLLDENMVEYIFERPLFVREYSKKMLRASLYNDTLFLTKMNVMDYSLVIGVDESTNTIFAGIIDFVRTYTWDKKIESWVKGKATSGTKEPTVVSPKQYKVRFRESMERYFVMVPDCWSQV